LGARRSQTVTSAVVSSRFGANRSGSAAAQMRRERLYQPRRLWCRAPVQGPLDDPVASRTRCRIPLIEERLTRSASASSRSEANRPSSIMLYHSQARASALTSPRRLGLGRRRDRAAVGSDNALAAAAALEPHGDARDEGVPVEPNAHGNRCPSPHRTRSGPPSWRGRVAQVHLERSARSSGSARNSERWGPQRTFRGARGVNALRGVRL
jgi:hypothetical protein